VQKSLLARWRSSFLTGLAVVLPAVVSFALIILVFGTVANVTDKLLFLVPRHITHDQNGDGPMYWYWSLIALVLAVILITFIGWLARYYVGQRMIEWADHVILRIPFLNKIYAATKQINEAFSSGSKNAFKTVVLVEFPRAGSYSVGFITSEGSGEIAARMNEKLVCVFIPTTPNPTSGFLILVPEDKVTKLEMSVADGIKYIISLGAISPDHGTAAKKLRN
jgi:uncharacterized membrane protein